MWPGVKRRGGERGGGGVVGWVGGETPSIEEGKGIRSQVMKCVSEVYRVNTECPCSHFYFLLFILCNRGFQIS